MKIGPLESKPAVPPPASERKSASAVTGPAGNANGEPSARVELSPAASALAVGSADPSFDSAKVDRIAQAIRDGRFEVDAEAIADKLIANAQELLGRSAR